MPGATPNFAIPYPCSGETITPGVFADWADRIDETIFRVTSLTATSLRRPRVSTTTALTGTSCNVGATTTLTAGTITTYNDQFLVSPTGLTAIVSGVYMVSAEFSPLTTVASVTSWSAQLDSASETYGRKLGISAANTLATNMNVSGLMRLSVGTPLSISWTWTGAGGPMFVYGNVTASLVCVI